MKSLKDTIMVSALSLGLIVGAVAAVNAATSVDPGPTATMTTVSPATDSSMAKAPEVEAKVVAAPVVEAKVAAAPVVAAPVAPAKVAAAPAAPAPVAPAKVAAAPAAPAPAQNYYQYNDGHSNMNPQQHQQMHVSATNNINGNGYATNHNNNEMHNTMGENHMNGGQYGYGHE